MRILPMLLGCAAVLAASALALPSLAQPRQNIAGNYRGLITGCLTAPQPDLCRKGLTELVRLADDVDAKHVEWESAARGGNTMLTERKHGDYTAALDRLNRDVVGFNRDMTVTPASAR